MSWEFLKSYSRKFKFVKHTYTQRVCWSHQPIFLPKVSKTGSCLTTCWSNTLVGMSSEMLFCLMCCYCQHCWTVTLYYSTLSGSHFLFTCSYFCHAETTKISFMLFIIFILFTFYRWLNFNKQVQVRTYNYEARTESHEQQFFVQ